MNELTISGPVVVIGNGPFPTGAIPLERIRSAGMRICLDGGADKLQEFGIDPDLIIGDMDSSVLVVKTGSHHIHQTPDQSKSDLEKALDWCLENDISSLTLVGLTGGRDDHHFANLLILDKFSGSMNLELLSDHSQITCHTGMRNFRSFKEQTVSLIPVKTIRKVTTDGLKYHLRNERLEPGTRGISNTSTGDTFTVTTSDPLWVFRSLKS